MYTCQHCKQKFNNVPYLCCTNGRKYCSLQCFPDSGIDEPYSSMYFNLLETIRDIDSRISGIVLLEDRIELENEVNELATSSFLETYGDNEGLFYKVQIEYLISTLDDLYDKIHDLFMKRKPQLKHGVEIYPDELERIVGKEILASAFNALEENLKHSSFENLYWEAPTIDFSIEIWRIKLAFSTVGECKEIERLFKKSINKYRSQLSKKQLEDLKDDNYHIYVVKFHQCPVCREWEDHEDFALDYSLNLFKCNQWGDCDEYDDYYKDESNG